MQNWQCYVVLTRTGQIVGEVPLEGKVSYDREVNQIGSWQVDVPLSEMDMDERENIREWTRPWKFSWVLAYGNYCVQGGPVVARNWSDSSMSFAVTGIGMAGVFDRRILKSTYTGPIADPKGDITFTENSLYQIMIDVIKQGTLEPFCGLPIDWPANDVSGNARTRTYNGYDLGTTGERKKNLQEVIDGPDTDFAPYITADFGYIRWQVRIGKPLLGTMNPNLIWDYGSGTMSIDEDLDGSNMAWRFWVKGSGSDRATLVGYYEDDELPNVGYPALDYINTEHTDVVDINTLNDYAKSYASLYKHPVTTWHVTVRLVSSDDAGNLLGQPTFGDFAPGDTGIFNIEDHMVIPPGEFTERILGWQAGENLGDVVLIIQHGTGLI